MLSVERMWALYPETKPTYFPNSVLYRRYQEETMARTRTKTQVAADAVTKVARNKSPLTLAAMAVGRTANRMSKLDEQIERVQAKLDAMRGEREECGKEADAALERLTAAKK